MKIFNKDLKDYERPEIEKTDQDTAEVDTEERNQIFAEAEEFLRQVAKKCYYKQDCYSPVYGNAKIDSYHDVKITQDEVERMMEIVQEFDLPFFPINTNMGFSIGFAIARPGLNINPVIREIDGYYIKFLEKQLPNGCDFNELSEVFLRPRNLELMKWYNLGEIKERYRYDY